MRRIVITIVALVLAASANAAEVYIVQGHARGPILDGIEQLLWSTDAYFYNSGSAAARVRLLGVSNIEFPVAPREFTLEPGRSAALLQVALSFGAVPPLWIVRADVPDDVDVESILLVGTISDNGVTPIEIDRYRFGKTRLPVFRELVPAGRRQAHLATFLGPPSRMNVAIYNAASSAATAHIEIRRHCDDVLVDQRDVSVPADTLIQYGGFQAEHGECASDVTRTSGPGVYTIVTVNQPSITFVSNIANEYSPVTSFSVTATP